MKAKLLHLNKFHSQHGVLTTFAGFSHALCYKGIIQEHLAVRNSVGLFDVTHMGRCTIEGPQAADLLEYLLTSKISSIKINQGIYTLMCNESGGIIDDLVVFHHKPNAFLLIYNSSNREKDYKWINSNAHNLDVITMDVSNDVAMFAIQGPKAVSMLQALSDVNLSEMCPFFGTWVNINGFEVFLTRSGYTGEDGFEVYLWNTPLKKSERAERLWEILLKAGRDYNCIPCGLGSRNSLRLEAGFCLYGNELDEDTTPLEAKLNFALHFNKSDFVGKEYLLKKKDEGLKKIRVAFRMLKSGIPRQSYRILVNMKEVGYVTSGTFSPILKNGIGLGYIQPQNADIGTHILVNIRGKLVEAKIVKTPFYNAEQYGLFRKKKS
jgi:aminomethyltransferase